MNKFKLIKRLTERLMRILLVNISALTLLIVIFLSNDIRADVVDTESLPEFDCVIEPSEIVDLGTALPGVIGAIYAERSDSVKKGEIVAELESSVEIATLKLSKARAELNTSIRLREESAAFGNRTQQRNQALYRKSSISQQAIDKLETENRIAQLQVHQERDNKSIAELEYRRAKAVLDRHLIRSPLDGVVMERFKTVGEYIEDDPVLRVARLDPLSVEVILPVEYMGRLVPGMRAEVIPDLPGFSSHIATVILVDKVADAASGTFGARLSLPNPDYAVPSGLRCRLAFLPPEKPSDNLLPVDTLLLSDTPLPSNTLISSETLLNMERVAVLTRDLPDSDKATLVILEPEQVPADEVLIESDAFSALEPDGITPLDFEDATNGSDAIANSHECYRVGPLANEVLASQLLNAMTDLDNKSKPFLDIEKSNKPTEYLVLTTSQPDEQATRELEEYLKNSGVNDIYRLRSGRNKGRISLGFYENEVNAFVRQSSLHSIGIEVEVQKVNRELITYWINLSLNSDPGSEYKLRNVVMAFAPAPSVQRTQCQLQHVARSDENNE